jgi:hypothetical protein
MLFLMGEIMKTNTTYFYKFMCALALSVLFVGFTANGIFAAKTKKTDAVLLDEFHATTGVTCADCHGADNARTAVTIATCIECHDTTELAEKTGEGNPTNPHKNRHYNTEADCNLCHHQHKKSENFCLPCHDKFDFVVP